MSAVRLPFPVVVAVPRKRAAGAAMLRAVNRRRKSNPGAKTIARRMMRNATTSAVATMATSFGPVAAIKLTKNPYMGLAFAAIQPVWVAAAGVRNPKFAPYASAYTACALYPWMQMAAWKMGLSTLRDIALPYPAGFGPETPLPMGDETTPADSVVGILDPLGMSGGTDR